MSLNIVVNHVAQHAVTADLRAADRLRSRLAAANSRWEAVCKSAGRIQGRLQAALMQVTVVIWGTHCEKTFSTFLEYSE